MLLIVSLERLRRHRVALTKGDAPDQFFVNDKPLQCLVCAHGRFRKRSAQLRGGTVSFFEMEWLAPSAICLVCRECGYVHWFLGGE